MIAVFGFGVSSLLIHYRHQLNVPWWLAGSAHSKYAAVSFVFIVWNVAFELER